MADQTHVQLLTSWTGERQVRSTKLVRFATGVMWILLFNQYLIPIKLRTTNPRQVSPSRNWTRDLLHHKRELMPVCHTTPYDPFMAVLKKKERNKQTNIHKKTNKQKQKTVISLYYQWPFLKPILIDLYLITV